MRFTTGADTLQRLVQRGAFVPLRLLAMSRGGVVPNGEQIGVKTIGMDGGHVLIPGNVGYAQGQNAYWRQALGLETELRATNLDQVRSRLEELGSKRVVATGVLFADQYDQFRTSVQSLVSATGLENYAGNACFLAGVEVGRSFASEGLHKVFKMVCTGNSQIQTFPSFAPPTQAVKDAGLELVQHQGELQTRCVQVAIFNAILPEIYLYLGMISPQGDGIKNPRIIHVADLGGAFYPRSKFVTFAVNRPAVLPFALTFSTANIYGIYGLETSVGCQHSPLPLASLQPLRELFDAGARFVSENL